VQSTPSKPRALTYKERAAITENAVTRKLFTLMHEKKTNLAFNPDVPTAAEFLALIDLVGPEICLLKTHIDMVEDVDSSTIHQLQELAQKHNFMILDDHKFSDIGAIAQRKYARGKFYFVEWADLVTVHGLAGVNTVKALKQEAEKFQKKTGVARGIFLVAQMSCEGNLLDENYTHEVVEMGKQHPDFVAGFIGQESLGDPGFITCTPGINISQKGDSLGQQFNPPEHAIGDCGTDIVIVGRGIYTAADPLKAAREYRARAWKAYEDRIRPD
jgi:uridine monophosphate synthetase